MEYDVDKNDDDDGDGNGDGNGGEPAATKTALPNHTMMGECYDILFIDPDSIASKAGKSAKGRKSINAFDLGELVDLRDQEASRPRNLGYDPGYEATGLRRETEQLSSYDFQTYVKNEASITVSDPTEQLFTATMSSTFEQASTRYRDTQQRGDLHQRMDWKILPRGKRRRDVVP